MNIHAEAERLNIPKRTKDQVVKFLAKCKKNSSDISAARLLINHGRLEDDAREYVTQYLK